MLTEAVYDSPLGHASVEISFTGLNAFSASFMARDKFKGMKRDLLRPACEASLDSTQTVQLNRSNGLVWSEST